jgi:hypothetical protein
MPTYRDRLSSAALKRGDKLTQRDDFLLRSTSRATPSGDVIVAALPVLARTPTDLTSVLMRLAARKEKLRSLAERVTVDPATADMDELKKAFQNAARRFSALGVPGGVASGRKRSADAEAKIKLVEPFWRLLEPTTTELCKTYGVSRPTLILKLGPRKRVQREYQAELREQLAALKIAEANRRRRRTREGNSDE